MLDVWVVLISLVGLHFNTTKVKSTCVCVRAHVCVCACARAETARWQVGESVRCEYNDTFLNVGISGLHFS